MPAFVAVLIASAGLALVLGGPVALAFLLGIGLPAWWIGYLALLARPASGADADDVEWYPVGRIVVWTAIIAAAASSIVTMLRYGVDAAQMQAGLRRELERALALPRRRSRPMRRCGSRASGIRSACSMSWC